jgi:hypothetical protein
VAPVVFKNANGEDAVRLPTAREELIEDVLRQMAIQQHRGFVGTQQGVPIFGVRFSMELLRRELARHGHSIKYGDLVDSLLILSGCVVEIGYAEKRTCLHRASILPHLAGVSRSDYRSDPNALWTAHFHPMVVSSLAAIAYRQYDYQTSIGYRSSLARWLHKHLALVYLNAAMTQSYAIQLSTIRDSSGLLNRPEVRHQARDVKIALEVLKTSEVPVLRDYQQEPIYQDRQLVDVHYQLSPTADFVKQTVAANRRQKDGKLALDVSPVFPAPQKSPAI